MAKTIKPRYTQVQLASRLAGTPKADKIIADYKEAVLQEQKELNKRWRELREQKQAPKPRKMTVKEVKQKFIELATELTRPPAHHPKHSSHKFIIDKENKKVIDFMFQYFGYLKLPAKVAINNPAHSKGVLIAGNYGSGKSVLFEIHRKMNWKDNKFRIVSAHEIVAKYDNEGDKGIRQYLVGNLCIDDLGTEEQGRYYGKQEDVLRRILELRYILFKREGKKTHATTNLDLPELKERYGARIASRLNEMFNILYLGATAESRDFRDNL